MQMKTIIIGATSGIGRELTKVLSSEGYVVGVTGRRLLPLEVLQDELVPQVFIKQMDVTDLEVPTDLQELIDEVPEKSFT